MIRNAPVWGRRLPLWLGPDTERRNTMQLVNYRLAFRFTWEHINHKKWLTVTISILAVTVAYVTAVGGVLWVI